jgi:hypothetical protein
VAEEGANTCLVKVAENCKNAYAGTALERGYISVTNVDGFV